MLFSASWTKTVKHKAFTGTLRLLSTLPKKSEKGRPLGNASQFTASFGLCNSIHCIAFPYRSRAKAYTARPPSAVSELDAPETMTVIKAHRQLAPAMDCVLLKMISMTGTPVGVDAVVSMSPMQKQRAMRACERIRIDVLARLDL